MNYVQDFEIIYPAYEISAKECFDVLLHKHEEEQTYDQQAFQEAHKELQNKDQFILYLENVDIHCSTITNQKIKLIWFRYKKEPHSSLADEWIKLFNNTVHINQSFLLNHEYNYWQNASDKLQYKAHGRNYKNLPLKSNGLPFPLEQEIIDTSKNPGRRVSKTGYVEAVSSPMWLGESFWNVAPRKKDEVLSDLQNYNISFNEDETGMIKIMPLPHTFMDMSSAEMQVNLRIAIFGTI